jgi:hypothetical protein
MKHDFTIVISQILEEKFGDNGVQIFQNSELIQYLNIKTVSVNRSSKARGSFGNLYAIYVLVKDYLRYKLSKNEDYSKYEGAKYSDLLIRQRTLPFGSKLQNHALNQRMNQEFKKYFPMCGFIPIIRIVETKRYWINENLLNIKANKQVFNIGEAVLEIISKYIENKTNAFNEFIETLERLKTVKSKTSDELKVFVFSLLKSNIDARIFEITSYAILKYHYLEQSIFFGWSRDELHEENLKLYKTGRTNANDGGIDFVMKPLGRFFQVTETTDVKKYFLDIDKLEKYPITFVIKSDKSETFLMEKIYAGAMEQYGIEQVVRNYMNCVEEIINIEKLKTILESIEIKGKLSAVLNEIITQSKIEFNFN